MSVTKQITIYEPPSVSQEKKYDLTTSTRHLDDFVVDEIRLRERLRTTNMPISSTMPSILIKNIIYNIMPILDEKAKYKMHIQLRVPIKMLYVGGSIQIKRENDIISMSGMYFDSESTFFRYAAKNNNLTDADRFIMGGNDLRDIEYTYDFAPIIKLISHFTMQRTEHALKPVRFAMKFSSAEDAMKKIQLVYAFMLSRRAYITKMYNYSQIYAPITKTTFVVSKKCSVAIKPIGTNIAISAMERMINMKLSHLDAHQFMSTITSFGLLFSYIKILTTGKVGYQKTMHSHKRCIEVKMTQQTHRSNIIKKQAKDAWLSHIADREFQKPYGELTQSQLTVVSSQYERELDAAEAIKANKCPHLRLLRKVMRSRSNVFNEEAWAGLKKYVPLKPKPMKNGVIKLPKYDTLLQCDMCHLSALCPHHYVLFDMKDAMFKGDINDTMEYVIRTFSKDMQSEDDSYYCRICGELIKRNLVEGEIWAAKNMNGGVTYNDTLSNIIRTEVWQTLSANIDLGPVSIDKMTLTNNIIDIINPFIRRYELKLTRIKTNTENMILFSLYLIISAYTLAVIIHLANVSGGDITIRGTDVKKLKGFDLLHRLFNSAYKLIVKQRANTINKVPAFTHDRIKKILTRAYQQVSGSHMTIQTTTIEHFDDPISNNMVYMYIYIGHVISAISAGKKRPAYGDTKSIIGVNLDKIKEMRMMFSKAKMPDAWKGFDSYYWDSYSATASRILSNTFVRNAKHKKAIDDAQNALQKRWDKMVADKAIEMNISNSKPHKWSKLSRSNTKDRSLSLLFCKDGRSHIWDIYVYKGGPRIVEVKLGQFHKNDISGLKLVTQKCSVCGDKYGETKHTDIKTIIAEANNKASFFKYYKYKCPKQYKHSFTKNACEHCGVTKTQLYNKDEKYYSKHREQYEKDKLKMSNVESNKVYIANEAERRRARTMMVVKKRENAERFKPWVYSNDNIIKLSKMIHVPYNIILNIGFTRNHYFDEIKNNKFNPSGKATNEMWLMQVSIVNEYITDFVSKYNRFVRCSSTAMNEELEEICKSKHNDVTSLKQLDLTQYYYERQYRRKEKPQHYANWTLFWFCDIIMRVYNEKKHSGINRKFVKIFANEFVEAEMNMSKPRLYKRVVVAAKDATDNVGAAVMPKIEITDDYAKEQINIDDGTALDFGDIDVNDLDASMGNDTI